MSTRSRIGASALALLTIALVAVTIEWSMPTQPAPLPAGAVQLSLHTRPSTWHMPLAFLTGCGTALLVPVVIAADSGTMTFRNDAGTTIDVEWPPGFSARRISGDAELVSPEGWVIGHTGDILRNLGDSALESGGFSVCFSSPGEYAPRP